MTMKQRSMTLVRVFLKGIRPYIALTKDMAIDGNCGFKVIARLLEYPENSWRDIRVKLLSELRSHLPHYKQIYGSRQRVNEFVKLLSYFDDYLGYVYWMTMPDCGHLIASRYDVVLYHLSMQQCLTFLPLRSRTLSAVARQEIVIEFVNGNHFIQVIIVAHSKMLSSNYFEHYVMLSYFL